MATSRTVWSFAKHLFASQKRKESNRFLYFNYNTKENRKNS